MQSMKGKNRKRKSKSNLSKESDEEGGQQGISKVKRVEDNQPEEFKVIFKLKEGQPGFSSFNPPFGWVGF